jgi:PAS domain S-box-containing protein
MKLITLDPDRLNEMLDYFAVGAVVLSLEKKIISINKSAELITGFNSDDVLGKCCDTVFEDAVCGGSCHFEDAISSGRAIVGVTSEKNSAGSHSISRLMVPLHDEQQKVVGCVEMLQDQTALKDLIERVRYDDRRLKIILDNLDLGVLTVDRGGHVTFFNAMAEKISGYKRQQLLGKPCVQILGVDFADDLQALNAAIAEDRARFSREGEIETAKGQRIPIRVNYLPLKNEEGRDVGALATITDLSLIHQLNSAIKDRYTFFDMIGKGPAMQKIFAIVPVVAVSDATVLIGGPTGTGKDVLAGVIHNASGRRDKPLVKVNCAALPDNLLESEMFGYVKGAFTGADADKPGRFQEADGGTIFLDEIGDLPLSLQAKMLRVLESRDFYPLGSRRPTKVDVRIISATNQDLARLVKEKRFREDLFYRLNVMCLELPPLKERQGDIPLLIGHIMQRLTAVRDTKVERIDEDAMQVLLNHDYPGNVRELENIIEHALIICQGDTIGRKHLPLSLVREKTEAAPVMGTDLRPPALADEKSIIIDMLNSYNGNRNKTAKALSIDRTTLWRKMKRHGLLP